MFISLQAVEVECERASRVFSDVSSEAVQSSATLETVVKHQQLADNLFHTKHLLESKLLLLMELYLAGSILRVSL